MQPAVATQVAAPEAAAAVQENRSEQRSQAEGEVCIAGFGPAAAACTQALCAELAVRGIHAVSTPPAFGNCDNEWLQGVRKALAGARVVLLLHSPHADQARANGGGSASRHGGGGTEDLLPLLLPLLHAYEEGLPAHVVRLVEGSTAADVAAANGASAQAAGDEAASRALLGHLPGSEWILPSASSAQQQQAGATAGSAAGAGGSASLPAPPEQVVAAVEQLVLATRNKVEPSAASTVARLRADKAALAALAAEQLARGVARDASFLDKAREVELLRNKLSRREMELQTAKIETEMTKSELMGLKSEVAASRDEAGMLARQLQEQQAALQAQQEREEQQRRLMEQERAKGEVAAGAAAQAELEAAQRERQQLQRQVLKLQEQVRTLEAAAAQQLLSQHEESLIRQHQEAAKNSSKKNGLIKLLAAIPLLGMLYVGLQGGAVQRAQAAMQQRSQQAPAATVARGYSSSSSSNQGAASTSSTAAVPGLVGSDAAGQQVQ